MLLLGGSGSTLHQQEEQDVVAVVAKGNNQLYVHRVCMFELLSIGIDTVHNKHHWFEHVLREPLNSYIKSNRRC